ncbi:hypothetical protein DPMN_132951 [Dreissena polymorpha]|uniref:Uncharacterized protein n=1 Tax=Dreissena polymorpha TaxID=45954 RepID=A0A9D4JDJ7_DREPO|nr:hypothetical protein DPMN_132951 [Dreissena polymorpha]
MLRTKFQPDGRMDGQTDRTNYYIPSKFFFGADKNGAIMWVAQNIIGTNLLTKKNAPPPGIHVFQPTSIIFEHFQDIMGMNLLTKKNAPPLGSHISLRPIFCLTKFHEDWTINVASRVSREKFPAPGGHVFTATKTIFELIQDIIGTNLQTKFHDDRKINVTSRVLTRGHAFLPIQTIFELERHIQKTHVLTKFHRVHIENCPAPSPPCFFTDLDHFHDDWAKIVTSRVFTRNTATTPGGHLHEDWASNVTSKVLTSFELRRGINGTNVLTKFHEDQTSASTINVASRTFTRQNVDHARRTTDKRRSQKLTMSMLCSGELKRETTMSIQHNFSKAILQLLPLTCQTRVKMTPLPSGHAFLPIKTIFELNQKTAPPPSGHFHDDWAKILTSRVFTRNTSPPPGGHVFQRTRTIFELNQHIIKTNFLTKLHEDWASNVASTVFTSFELSRGIDWTNVLTKFHENQTINVASEVFTTQNVDDARQTTHDRQKAITKAHHEHVVLR